MENLQQLIDKKIAEAKALEYFTDSYLPMVTALLTEAIRDTAEACAEVVARSDVYEEHKALHDFIHPKP